MGLSQATKNFFIEKITKKILGDIKKINATINTQAVKTIAEERFLREIGALDLASKYEQIKEEEERLRKEREQVLDKIQSIGKQNGVNCYWSHDTIDSLKRVGRERYEQAVMEDNYPDEAKKLAKLNAMREDVEGVVLLATTPTRLQSALTSLLEQYGAELEGVENIINSVQ